MEYYNRLYRKMRSQEAIRLQKQEEILLAKAQPSRCKRIFCCVKKLVKLPEAEVMEEINYSSGESGEDENRVGRQFLKMKEFQKDNHIR
jgi:hypothetical protein